jgi:GntR family transcriptional regulator
MTGSVYGMTAPTYIGLADEFEQELRRLAPGTRLPAETELAKVWGVNRLTARAAMQELEQRHVIRRRHGSGTFVARRIDYVISPQMPPSWSHGIRQAGARPHSETESLRTIRASAEVRRELALPVGARVVRIARRRYVDDDLAAYAVTHIAADLVPGFADRMSGRESLHAVLTTYDLRPHRAWVRAELEVCPAEVAEALGLRKRRQLLHCAGRTDSGPLRRPVELTTTWMLPELFRLVFSITDQPNPEE